jgi:hypothetical protein
LWWLDVRKKLTDLKFLVSILMVNGLLLAGALPLAAAQASTSVTGVISSDTVWTKASSPYTLTGAVGVARGVTLTIEVGVTVNLGDNYLQVNGTLKAIGNAAGLIHFNGGRNPAIVFTDSSSDWNETTASGCIIENAIISRSDIQIINASLRISNNTFNCRISAFGDSPYILNNVFQGGDGIVLYDSNATVRGNVFSDTSQAIYVGGRDCSPLIERNLIVNSGYGVVVPSSSGEFALAIVNNTLANNTDAICIAGGGNPSPTIMYNNIYGSEGYNFRLTEITNNINASYNWWGTTDTEAISQSIYDFKNDFSLGNVTFVPFLTELNPQAMPDPSMLTQLPSATPTPEPSAIPSQTPDATPTPDSNNFNIESNSTVSAFSFNSSVPELSFTVSGETGTTGYVKATISKSFMPDAENIKVYLDGNQTDYSLDSDGNSWIVTFTYQHSTHQVTINAATETPANFSVFPDWIWQAAIIIVIASIITATCLFVWSMKTKTKQATVNS